MLVDDRFAPPHGIDGVTWMVIGEGEGEISAGERLATLETLWSALGQQSAGKLSVSQNPRFHLHKGLGRALYRRKVPTCEEYLEHGDAVSNGMVDGYAEERPSVFQV